LIKPLRSICGASATSSSLIFLVSFL